MGNGVTRKAAKNIVASSSYRTPSKSVLPVQRTVPSVATGKRILWWTSKGRACLVTLVDRKSRYLLGGKAMSKTAAAVNKMMCEALSEQSHLSVTPDRGKESRNMLRSKRS